MRSAVALAQPAPVGAGYCNRRRAFTERELPVLLFGGTRETVAAVAYKATWVSTGSFPARVPLVDVRGVYSLKSGACLLNAVGQAQLRPLAEHLENLLLAEGEHAWR